MCNNDGVKLLSFISSLTKASDYKLEHQRFPLNIKKHCENDRALEQFASISILGNAQRPSGHGCRQHALGGTA